jgi:Glycosyltransferase family 87
MLGVAYTASLLFDAVRAKAGSDFAEYIAAARLTLRSGSAAPYQPVLFVAELRALGQQRDTAVNTPIIHWLVVPFTVLPLHLAYLTWLVVLLGALTATWWMAAPGNGGARRWHLLAALGVFPVYYALWEGQMTLLVVGLFVLHWWLIARGHPLLAGVALGLACLKPQMVALVPFALLLSGRWSAALACLMTVLALAAASLALMGLAGLHGYQYSLSLELAREPITRHTLSGQLPGWVPMPPLQGLIAAVALLPALFEGTRDYGRAAAAAAVGSLLVTPYLNPEDLAILVPCAWLFLRTEAPAWARPALMASYLVIALDPAFYLHRAGLLILGTELLWLGVLAWLALKGPPHRPGGSLAGRPRGFLMGLP